MPDAAAGPEGWSSRNKFTAAPETAALIEADLGEYCRKRGLYPAQIAAGLSRLETHGQNTRTYHDQKARLVVFDAGIPCQNTSTRPPRPKRDSPANR
jgi:hypothetical protein